MFTNKKNPLMEQVRQCHEFTDTFTFSERLPNFPPLMNVLKRFFFDGAYIEKWGIVFWGESNKEDFFFFFFFYYGRNIPFIYYLLTYLLFLPCILTHFIIFITDNELTLCRFEPKRTVWFGLCVVTDCLTN